MVGTDMYADIQELRALGYSKLRAARELNIDKKTVKRYWDMSDDEYVEYVHASKTRNRIMERYRSFVLDRLQTNPEITSAIIDDNLREAFPDFEPSYRSVRLFVSTLREEEGMPRPAKIRQYGENPELPFGYQAQVDMGQKTMKDAQGRTVKVYAFAMVLSSSRYKYVCFQLEPFTAQTFCEAHDKAFRYFGGRPAEIVYDQDRVMVVSENGGDIIFTETFENYKNYAGFSIHLCRGHDPESKGKIEAVVKYVKGNFLSCRTFHGIARLNSDGLAWLDRTGNGLVHETTKMVPKVVFNEEQKHLKAVPKLSAPTVPKTAIVRKTNVVMFRQNRYCVPLGTYRPGKKVRIQADDASGMVRFYDLEENTLLEEHPIYPGRGKCVGSNHRTRDRHSTYDELRAKAMSGFHDIPQAKIFIDTMLALKPRYTRDQLSIVIKLQEVYSTDALETAVTYCLERNLFGASDFKDTLEYFTQRPEPPILRDIRIPVKYSIITAVTRPLEAYTALMTKGGAL